LTPQPGQVWRDTINQDLLLVQEIDPPWTEFQTQTAGPERRYARCLAFCSPETFETRPGLRFMGTQEMQFKHFHSGRFIKLGILSTLYYRWRMKTWVKEGGM